MKQFIEEPVCLAFLTGDAGKMAFGSVAAGKAAAVVSHRNRFVGDRVGRVGEVAVGRGSRGVVPRSGRPLCIPLVPGFFVPFIPPVTRITATLISRFSKGLVRLISLFDGVIPPPVMREERNRDRWWAGAVVATESGPVALCLWRFVTGVTTQPNASTVTFSP